MNNKVYNKVKKIKNMIMYAAIILFAVTADQWTKRIAENALKGKAPVVLIKNVLELSYLENHGAAFGIMQGRQTFFYILTAAVLTVLVIYLIKTPCDRPNHVVNCVLAAIMGGAVGNFIDRFTLKYVIDFIYFKLIDFPVFNVADIFVSVGAVVLIILIVFVYKEDEIFIFGSKEPEPIGTKEETEQAEQPEFTEDSRQTRADEKDN